MIAGTAIAAALLSGCAGTTATSARVGVVFGHDVVYVDPPPAYVYGYTPVYYHSHPAYWVDGRWYYYSPTGWVVFRQEPRALRSYRLREYRGMYSAPPLHRYERFESPSQQRYRAPAPRRAPAAPPRRFPSQSPSQQRQRVPAR